MDDVQLPADLRPPLVTRARVFALGSALAVVLTAAAGAWLVMIRMPGTSHRGPLPAPSAGERALAAELEADVRALAALGEKSVARPAALGAAADLVAARFVEAGHEVRHQWYDVGGVRCENLVVRLPGERPDEVVVIGAHYDSAEGTPGANDDGSGVAALLAIARRTPSGFRGARTLELVAFTNEEMPHFRDGTSGSRHHARSLAAEGATVTAMLSLETMGYFDDREGSQRYPFPLSVVYPSRGDFIAFVGDVRSRALVREVVGAFRAHARFPSEGAALPADVPGVGWSDHRSYWEQGWPAMMVTDTALFRYPHYHLPTDTPDRIDFDRLARVVEGLAPVVASLAWGR